MADVIISPNMSLPVPVPSVCPGPLWAAEITACMSILDQHTHAPGSGVLITQNGINLTPAATTFDSLGFNTSNAFDLRSIKFSPQGSALGLGTDIGCLYEAGVDLYYNDGSGNQIRLTQSGSPVGGGGSITGLPSGTASASYSGATFVWQSATNTAANMDAGSVILRNGTAMSKGLTLSPPNAMAANYALTLPAIPGGTSFTTLDTSGNMSGATPYPLTAAGIASQTITASQIANNTITRNQEAAVGQQLSSSCGSFSTASASFVDVTNLTVTITTTGRPVVLALISDGSGAACGIGSTNSINSALFLWVRGITDIAKTEFNTIQTGLTLFIDVVGAGTYVYKIQATAVSGTTAFATNLKLLAYEL